jgi:hypothetical protein
MSNRPLPQYTIEQLQARAAEFDAMAATASTQAVKEALERLAARFRAAAAQRAAIESVLPGG